MMEKKRSIGVTRFAWMNIVVGILGTVALLGPYQMKMYGAPLLIIIGVGLLKLNEWARKFEIYLTILGYLLTFIMVLVALKDLFSTVKYMFQLKELISLLAVIITVYFFTRPKVKEQFSPERGEDESKEAV